MIDFALLSRAMEQAPIDGLAFREARPADGWVLFDATRNPSFNRYLMWSRPSEPYETVARMESIVDAHHRGDMCALSIMAGDTNQWVGMFRFLRYRHDPKIVEISLWTHSDFYHAFNGLKIVQTALQTLFKVTDVQLVLAGSYPGNRAAQRILEICGFSYDSVVPRPHEDGHMVDLLEFRLSRARWEIQRQSEGLQATSLLADARRRRRALAAANLESFRVVSGK